MTNRLPDERDPWTPERDPWTAPLTPAELAYMHVEAAMPDRPSWVGRDSLRAIADQLGVKP